MNHPFLDTDFISKILNTHSIVYLFITLLLFYLAKQIFDFFTPYNLNEQLTKIDNKAVGLSFSGYLLAVGIIFLGVLQSEEYIVNDTNSSWVYYLADFGLTFLWCILGIFLLHVSRFINDKIIFHKFDNIKELIEDQNIGTGAIECGSYISSGFIISAILYGENNGILNDLLATIVFFLITQFLFIIFTIVYQKLTRFDLHKEIENDNIAAGISAGINFIAMGVLLHGFLKKSDSIIILIVWFICSMFLLFTNRYIVDKLMLPGNLLDEEIKEDKNWVAALIEGTVAIIIAFIVNISFLD